MRKDKEKEVWIYLKGVTSGVKILKENRKPDCYYIDENQINRDLLIDEPE